MGTHVFENCGRRSSEVFETNSLAWRKYPPETDFKPTLKPDSKPKPKPNLKTSLEAIFAVIFQSNMVHILYTKLELWALHLRG